MRFRKKRRREFLSGDRIGDCECASADMIVRDGPRRIGEEEIDVIASDRMIAVRGRIESGAAFGMLGGGWERTGASDNENLSVEEACSAAKDDWRRRVCEERDLECILITFLTGKVHFVDPAIVKWDVMMRNAGKLKLRTGCKSN